MTAYDPQALQMMKGYAVGGADYILAPVNPDLLRAKVSVFVDLHNLAETVKQQERALRELELKEHQRQLLDTTQRLEAEARAKLLYQAQHDTLTNLPNAALYTERLERAVAYAEHHDGVVGVLFLALDRFKLINSTLGQDTGDQLMRAVAATLSNAMPEEGHVARAGSDEFMLLIEGVSTVDEVRRTALQILATLNQPFTINQQTLYVNASIGISLFPNDALDVKTLMKSADAALYRAKEQGGNVSQFYSTEMNALALERLTIETDLRRAVEHGEFIVYYQPQVDLATGIFTGAEALVRWLHPTLGFLPPSKFIPVAEEMNLIGPMGQFVMDTACQQNAKWQNQGLPSIRMAVNLSARQFQQPDLIPAIVNSLNKSNLDPTWLEIELTESAVMGNVEQSITKLSDLKKMGIHLSIDDFGTGYSSLSYLKRFPLDMLKIDQSFVRDIITDHNDSAIVVATIALAHSLGLEVIAEGVETQAQRDFYTTMNAISCRATTLVNLCLTVILGN